MASARSLLLAALVALLVAPMPTGLADAQDDCGEGRDASTGGRRTVLNAGSTCEATVGGGDTSDVFWFTPAADRVFRIAAGPSTVVRSIEVSNALGAWWGDDRAPVDVALFLRGGVAYQIRVHPLALAEPERYSITVTDEGAWADLEDCGGPGDAPSGIFHDREWAPPPEGRALTVPAACSGALEMGDRVDAYAFDALPTGATSITVSTDAEAWVHLSGSCCGGASGLFLARPGAPATVPLHLSTGTSQTWSLRVHGSAAANSGGAFSSPLTYAITLGATSAPAADDCGTGGDLAVVAPGAVGHRLLPDAPCDGALAVGDAGDLFALPRPAAPSYGLLTITGPVSVGGAVRVDAGPYLVWPGGASQAEAWVRTALDRSAAYSASIAWLPDPQDDCGVAHDASGELAWPERVLADGVTCDAEFLPGDRSDTFAFPEGLTGAFEIRIPGSGIPLGDPDLHATRPWRGYFDGDHHVVAGFADDSLGVTFRSASPANYSFATRYVPADDCGTGRDLDALVGSAFPLPLPGACGAALTLAADLRDDFTLQVPGPGVILASVEIGAEGAGLARPDVRLEGPDGLDGWRAWEPFGRDSALSPSPRQPGVFAFPVGAAGAYALTVEGLYLHAVLPYTLEVTFVPGAALI